jgi:fatty-acyl-CoA synthase
MSASSWVSGWSRIKPQDHAVVFEDGALTWQDLDQRASAIARAFVGAGIEPGDRIACLMNNRVEFLEVFVGSLRAGAVFVPLNALAPAPALAALVADCGARIVVTDSSFSSQSTGMVRHGVAAKFVTVDDPLDVPHRKPAGADRRRARGVGTGRT